ncbi:MAG TPA: PP2C family protein-serine/threonine phosphatase [Tepidisphaeraceae bacterium]|jgi:serine phosphatase RsbU (regulator of sigma subunit)
MEEAAKRFARRVLTIHLALLAIVIGLVFFASREVYYETRRQATQQAESRQALLAGQTARGIEAFYHSIFSDLDLLRQADRDEGDETERPTTAPSSSPGAAHLDWRMLLGSFSPVSGGKVPGGGPRVDALPLFADILWKQLDGRVSMLLSVNRAILGRRADRPARFPAIQEIGTSEARLTPEQVIERSKDWLHAMAKPQISRFQQYEVAGEMVGLNLVGVPLSEKNPRVLVAAVPIRIAQGRFMDKLNNDSDSTNAILADETGTVMVSSKAGLVGREVMSLRDDHLRELARSYLGTGRRGVETIQTPYSVAGHEFPPAMVAVEPVSIAGKKWTFMVITPLSDVDAVVNRVFKRAVFWAIFVVCSMTAILLSTAVQLIRARVRMERVRHEALTRELNQAREIQLAWLPRQGVTVPSMDIAAVNQPASHISGDFYNWFELPDGRTVVTIGDVTGHGLSAAFLMATTQLLVHTTMLRLGDPGKTLFEVNKQLCTQVFNGQFVTMLVCVIDKEAGTVDVATAGHYPPILGNKGHFEPLPVETQLVLGVEKDTRYPTQVFDLPAGASLVLYTDGVIDARSPDGKRFDLRHVLEVLEGQNASAQGLVDTIVGRINHFRGERELPDDLTLVCIQTQMEQAFSASEAVQV